MGGLINFFAYGELMNQELMKEMGLEYKALFCVTLSAWKLTFNKIPEGNAPPGLGLPNIVPAPSNLGMMEGVMYEMDEKFLPRLDEIHHCPGEYARKVMRCTKHDFTLTNAYIYIARPEKTQEGLKPSKAMMKKIRGARKNLQMLYFSRLMNTPTVD
ncbi:MAG: gamma-glutamylcyclotransferase [Nitrospinae bacterium]|nr:gamma-glutamylcyclotransferase [Nitrospinota bacterium]